MSLQAPTVSDISSTIISQLESKLNQTIPSLPKSFVRVLAKVLAGAFILVYKYAGFMFLQMFVSTASSLETEVNGKTVRPLVEWGRLIGIGDPTDASQALLSIEVQVLNQTGNLPSGSQLVNPNSGVVYLTLATVALDAATKNVDVKAASDPSGGRGAGEIGNMEVGQTLQFANPLPNVATTAEVTIVLTPGSEPEDIEVYRQRVLDRFRRKPQGGAPADYALWGSEPVGSLAAYPYKSPIPGRVDVYLESSDQIDGIPTTGQLEAALEAIVFDSGGLPSRRPTNDLVNVYPITRTAFDVEVVSLDVDNEAQVQTDIQEALEEFFLAREPYILGLSPLPRKDRVTRSSIGGVIDDIVSAAGGIFAAVYVYRTAVSIEVYSLDVGEKCKLGTISFV